MSDVDHKIARERSLSARHPKAWSDARSARRGVDEIRDLLIEIRSEARDQFDDDVRIYAGEYDIDGRWTPDGVTVLHTGTITAYLYRGDSAASLLRSVGRLLENGA